MVQPVLLEPLFDAPELAYLDEPRPDLLGEDVDVGEGLEEVLDVFLVEGVVPLADDLLELLDDFLVLLVLGLDVGGVEEFYGKSRSLQTPYLFSRSSALG